jgi:hypothetical protein
MEAKEMSREQLELCVSVLRNTVLKMATVNEKVAKVLQQKRNDSTDICLLLDKAKEARAIDLAIEEGRI